MSTEVGIDSILTEGRVRADLGDLDGLMESIREVGLLHPPVVRPTDPASVRYILVAGFRRLEALRRLGFDRVPVTVARNLNDELAALAAERDENTCRKDFTPTEAVTVAGRIESIERERAMCPMVLPEPPAVEQANRPRRTDIDALVDGAA